MVVVTDFGVAWVLLDCPLWGPYKEVNYAKCRHCEESREAGLTNLGSEVNQPTWI